MNAKEARERAYSVNTSAVNSGYSNLKKLIETAVGMGKYEAYSYDSILPDVRRKLEEEGFKISSFFDQKDGTTITISW